VTTYSPEDSRLDPRIGALLGLFFANDETDVANRDQMLAERSRPTGLREKSDGPNLLRCCPCSVPRSVATSRATSRRWQSCNGPKNVLMPKYAHESWRREMCPWAKRERN
jgi:hypothetical protein